jgi:hypothetical protein
MAAIQPGLPNVPDSSAPLNYVKDQPGLLAVQQLAANALAPQSPPSPRRPSASVLQSEGSIPQIAHQHHIAGSPKPEALPPAFQVAQKVASDAIRQANPQVAVKEPKFTQIHNFKITWSDRAQEGLSLLLRAVGFVASGGLALISKDFRENWRSDNRVKLNFQAKLLNVKASSDLSQNEVYVSLTEKMNAIKYLYENSYSGLNYRNKNEGGTWYRHENDNSRRGSLDGKASHSEAKQAITYRAHLTYLRAAFVLEHAKSAADYDLLLEDLRLYVPIDSNLGFDELSNLIGVQTLSVPQNFTDQVAVEPLILYLKGRAYLEKPQPDYSRALPYFTEIEGLIKTNKLDSNIQVSHSVIQSSVSESLAHIRDFLIKEKAAKAPESLTARELKFLAQDENSAKDFLRVIAKGFIQNPHQQLSHKELTKLGEHPAQLFHHLQDSLHVNMWKALCLTQELEGTKDITSLGKIKARISTIQAAVAQQAEPAELKRALTEKLLSLQGSADTAIQQIEAAAAQQRAKIAEAAAVQQRKEIAYVNQSIESVFSKLQPVIITKKILNKDGHEESFSRPSYVLNPIGLTLSKIDELITLIKKHQPQELADQKSKVAIVYNLLTEVSKHRVRMTNLIADFRRNRLSSDEIKKILSIEANLPNHIYPVDNGLYEGIERLKNQAR